jgi:Signal transduction histidine kinase regulating citrate/malate metabolism
MLLLIISIIIHVFDCIMFYYLCYNLVEKRPHSSGLMFLIAVFYGIALGPLAVFLDGYIYRIIVTFTIMLILKFLSKKRIHDVLIIYLIAFLCILMVQVLATLSIGNLVLNQAIIPLLAQIISLIIILFFCNKVELHKVIYIVEKEILLKLFIFSMVCIFSVAFSYFNFEYSESKEYVLYFFILVLITFVGLYRTIKRVFFYTNRMPMHLHDVKNLIMGIYISIHSISDIEVIREEVGKSLAILDLGFNVENINVGKYNKNILSFINKKKYIDSKELTFSTDIRYYEANTKVPFSVILYMLGVLLDNAIESRTNKIIFIKVIVVEEGVLISVANEYSRKSKDDFQKMFQQGHSTKSASGRGYGLSNLSKVVRSYGGDIRLQCDYNKEQKCDYLLIIIDIKIKYIKTDDLY